jgi:predicted negative regulator of RcsB-dependent stress response
VLDLKRSATFDALFLDLRGDVLIAQGDAPAARTAYQNALERMEANSPYRALVEVKLDAAGGAR